MREALDFPESKESTCRLYRVDGAEHVRYGICGSEALFQREEVTLASVETIEAFGNEFGDEVALLILLISKDWRGMVAARLSHSHLIR